MDRGCSDGSAASVPDNTVDVGHLSTGAVGRFRELDISGGQVGSVGIRTPSIFWGAMESRRGKNQRKHNDRSCGGEQDIAGNARLFRRFSREWRGHARSVLPSNPLALEARAGPPGAGLLSGLFELGVFAESLFPLHRFTGRGSAEGLDLARGELAKISDGDVECERAVADAADLFDVVTYFLEHFPQLAVAALGERDLVPGVFAAANQLDTCG